MRHRRLCIAAAGILLFPSACSDGSTEPQPSVSTLEGIWSGTAEIEAGDFWKDEFGPSGHVEIVYCFGPCPTGTGESGGFSVWTFYFPGQGGIFSVSSVATSMQVDGISFRLEEFGRNPATGENAASVVYGTFPVADSDSLQVEIYFGMVFGCSSSNKEECILDELPAEPLVVSLVRAGSG